MLFMEMFCSSKIKAINSSIKNYENTGKELEDQVTEKDVFLNSQKEACINLHEAVEALTFMRNISIVEGGLLEERATESEEIIKLQEKELESLTDVLKNSRYSCHFFVDTMCNS